MDSTLTEADLPAEFPVFPLSGVLLLPHGRLPLNIFEPRYLAMTEDALAGGRLFGIIQPAPSTDDAADTDEEPDLYHVGCLGRLSSFSETDDGRYLITMTGVVRFTVAAELAPHRGYRRVRADYTRFLADLDPAPAPARIERDTLLSELRGFFTRAGLDANWDAVRRMPDDMLVVTLSMACPFHPLEKQALLEADTVAERAETLIALLRMGGRGEDEPGGLAS